MDLGPALGALFRPRDQKLCRERHRGSQRTLRRTHSLGLLTPEKVFKLPRVREFHLNREGGQAMASATQTAAARKNIRKAVAAAKKKKTIAHLPKKTRTALGKQGAKVAKQKRAA